MKAFCPLLLYCWNRRGDSPRLSDTERDVFPLCKGAPDGVRAAGGFFVAIRDTVSQSTKRHKKRPAIFSRSAQSKAAGSVRFFSLFFSHP